MAGPFCSPVCSLLFSCMFCSPVSRFTFRLSCLLPGFFFATRYNREEYSLLLAAFTFCLPLSPFACRLERVVDPGQQRVEEKTPYREVFQFCFPVLFFAFRKKAAILPGLIGKIFRIGNIIQKHTDCPGIDHGYPKNTGKNFPKPGRLVVNGNHNPVSRLTMFQMQYTVKHLAASTVSDFASRAYCDFCAREAETVSTTLGFAFTSLTGEQGHGMHALGALCDRGESCHTDFCVLVSCTRVNAA